MHWAIFDNEEQYQMVLAEINLSLGYPNNHGTDTYYFYDPPTNLDGKPYMPVVGEIVYIFDANNITLVDNISPARNHNNE